MSVTPYIVTANTFASGTATEVLTVGQINGTSSSSAFGTSANDVLYLGANNGGSAGSQTITAVVDSKGNVWEKINSDQTEVNTSQWATVGNTVPLVKGTDTISVTFSGTAGERNVFVVGMTGVLPAFDNVALPATTNSAAATSASITSGTFTEPNEVVLALLSTGSIVTAPSWGTGWTQIINDRQSGAPWLTLAYQTVSATSPVTATATFASAKYCLLMASFVVPSPSFPYIVGEASAPSGGSANLVVPIRQQPTQGDTIHVGVLATAGSVSGVSDIAGNTYTQVQAETTNSGCQVYDFAAYNVDPIVSGTLGSSGLFGNTCDFRNYTYGYTATHASPCAFTVSGTATPPANGQNLQLNGGTAPGGFTNGTTYYVVNAVGPTFNLASSPGGTPINSTSTGSGTQTLYLSTSDTETSVSQLVDTYSTIANWAYGPGSAQKVYYNAGKFPQSYSLQSGQSVQSVFLSGTQLWLCYQPNPNGSDNTAFMNSLTWWAGQVAANPGTLLPKVVIFQEPQGGHGLTGASEYITCVRTYVPNIRTLGFGFKIVYDASGSQPGEWASWYPGHPYIDEIAVDFYGSAWSGQTQRGTTNLDPLLPLRNIADGANPKKPFGLGEIGQAVYGSGSTLSNTLFIQYIQYLTGVMGGRLQQGLTNSDVMWYNGLDGSNGNTIVQNDWRIPYLVALQKALEPTTVPSITVTYSGTSSVQAAIAVGDNNVANAVDKVSGATATSGTTESASTGTLSQAGEHIISFFGDLVAGGVPVLGDSLFDMGYLEGGTTAYLKAGFKTVTTTASDTPSATITSTTWAMTVVTDEINIPVITNVPSEGFTGQAYSQTMMETGGIPAISWTVSTGSLPPGLSLGASTGIISGTPTTAGTYPFTLTATDSLGNSGSEVVSITIVGVTGAGGAPRTPLQNNVLTYADSDGEISAGFSWAAYANASAPSETNEISIAGSNSITWTALAAGTTQIATGLYPAVPDMPYITSGFLLTPVSLPTCVGYAWYDSTMTLIDVVDLGTFVQSNSGGWQPLHYASVSPGNAAFVQMIYTVQNASAGMQFNIELSYVTQSEMQILIDWNNPTFLVGGPSGQMFMDVSPFVRLDGNGVTYMRGRHDAISEIQAGSANFILENNLGTFTDRSNNAIPAVIGGKVTLQRRCQINFADEGGTWWTRFDGSISEIDYDFDPTGATGHATITLTDILAYLNRQDPLFCWTKENVLSNSPIYHWSLDDPGNTGGTGPAGQGTYGTAAETSGFNGPPMRMVNSDTTAVATIAWQDTTGGVETLADAVTAFGNDGSEFWAAGSVTPTTLVRGLDSGTVGPYTTSLGSVYFTPVVTAQTGQNMFIGNRGYMLQAELPTPIAPTAIGSDYSIECWFTMDPSIRANLTSNFGPYIPIALGTSRTFTNLLAGLFLNSGALKFECATYSQPPAFLGLNWPGSATPTATAAVSTAMNADKIQTPHHVVIQISGDPNSPTVVVWLDGSQVGTFSLPKGQVYDTICVGGAYGGTGAHFGNVSCVSIYNYVMPIQQIIQDCSLGQYGMWEQTSDNCMQQLAQYSGVPAFWNGITGQNFGLTMCEYMDITGSNALSAMQVYEQAEAGLLFVNSIGALTFHTRDWRMGYGSPDLQLPPGTFDNNLQYEVIDQFMCNEMAISGPSTLGATNSQATSTTIGTGNVITVPQEPLDTTTSGVLQAGYINQSSQEDYGVYATNPVSSPLPLPLITWSRAYAKLGIPSSTYWPDPNLTDRAAWQANSRQFPWVTPATVNIDLLTLDPNTVIQTIDSSGNPVTAPIAISDFYNLDIDNMVVPSGTMPESFPSIVGSTEWFIEGVTETFTLESRTLTFYVSPAQPQRAWVPGDPVYGNIGFTTRLGISQVDLSTPQADGKDVSHDAGPPYWPPTFNAEMNNPNGNGNGFVGAADLRGIVQNLQNLLEPPMCVVSALSQTQSFNNGSLSGTMPPSTAALFWDTVHVDTAGGMGLIPGYPNWYVCLVPGFYEIDGCVTWSLTGAGLAGYTGQAWVVVAENAAQAIAAGSGTPFTVGQYVCPVGSAVRFNASSMTPIDSFTTRMYLGLGDMVCIAAEQNYTSSRGTSSAGSGSHMGLSWTGLGTMDDRTEINSSIANGGSVSLVSHGTPQQKQYINLHTYSYQGGNGFEPDHRRNTDGAAFQATNGSSDSEGSQKSQISFNAAQMVSDLTGHTITSATLTCTNATSWYSTGSRLMLGWTKVTPGGLTYDPSNSNSELDIMFQKFQQGQTLTFGIPTNLVTPFVTGGATALVIGDDKTNNLDYYGSWNGGPGTWTLTINYV